jgi:TonB family protein
MQSTTRLNFFTRSISLSLALFCILLAQTTNASCVFYIAQRAEDHSPAYKEGWAALRENNYEKAVEHFKQASADKPDDVWAFYYVGLSLLRLNKVPEAVSAYRQALAIRPELAIKPETAPVHYQLGKIYLDTGDQEAAEKERQWLQEHDKELALYLSDPLQPDKLAAQENQKEPASSANNKAAVDPMTKDLRPTILYREKAKYTEIARINLVQGTVVLSVIFDVSGALQNIRVIRGLPDGLTHKAIEAARKIRFNPAIRNGEPVSVRGSLEFTFNLY